MELLGKVHSLCALFMSIAIIWLKHLRYTGWVWIYVLFYTNHYLFLFLLVNWLSSGFNWMIILLHDVGPWPCSESYDWLRISADSYRLSNSASSPPYKSIHYLQLTANYGYLPLMMLLPASYSGEYFCIWSWIESRIMMMTMGIPIDDCMIPWQSVCDRK